MDSKYIGTELEIFEGATNWKQYFRRHLRSYLGETVLEVGAGNGGTTVALIGSGQRRWLCLEPDGTLAEEIAAKIESGIIPGICEVQQGTLVDLSDGPLFDTILYIDVLEHIEDDRGEVRRAVDHLEPGGHLIVLAPAHQFLYSAFDKQIGHFRRYTKNSLSELMPDDLTSVKLVYLDTVGVTASVMNRLVLKKDIPSHSQIQLWDKGMIPISRILDPLLRYNVGKSVLGIWRKGTA